MALQSTILAQAAGNHTWHAYLGTSATGGMPATASGTGRDGISEAR